MTFATSLSSLARRSVLTTVSRKALLRPPSGVATAASATTLLKYLSSSSEKEGGGSKNKLPDEEYYHGHLMTDHLEFLDDMIEKTVKMEESMEGLKDTYAKKRKAYDVGWNQDSNELDRLFDTAATQKEELSGQVQELKSLLEQYRQSRASGFAVDAPDGTSDALRTENLRAVNDMIAHASTHEDKDQVLFKHKMQMTGVDAPDGTSDAMRQENLQQAAKTIAYDVEHKEEIEAAHKEHIRGVDAPDGTSDAMTNEDLKQVDEIIDYAAKHEDKGKIEYEHKMEQAVRKEHARDPERDW